MNTQPTLQRIGSIAAAALFAIAVAQPAMAQHPGTAAGGHAGSAAHGGGAGSHLGGGAPGRSGGPQRGGPGGGFRRGYGGYYGWRGYGWGPRWGWGPGWGWGPAWGWGWGWGWPLGVYITALPLYYSTFWWNGVLFYYANGNYYVWNADVGQYEQIQPSPELKEQASGKPAGSADLFAYPKNGQSTAQQAADKAECRRWAKEQTGFDPAQPSASSAKSQDYLRAEAACLEGRGYSVE
jgi:hypothetical protein